MKLRDDIDQIVKESIKKVLPDEAVRQALEKKYLMLEIYIL